ncbi:carboxymuconolactone decarboxylase family protein [Actinacidiphila epipremni]|uniref:Carboxymuconolactone decarboxylase family protein n=1 Tax=Actinacidiphila epipremni TaxID=2053013 RepID=A0ABX0ZHB7_9ACTN|nr:carboxymuconolactone decarboxylase family protein [Actinacidiphila epipremni]NJP43218.1 carboxymuconolactone decarboxylase family protein [Actinacidiphila epipremni]
MEPRINALGTDVGQKFVKHIVGADRVLAGSALSNRTRELVNIRASQINGCGACLDMHVKEAQAAGETPLRLALVAAWRETSVFTDAERAALELTEAGTRFADGSGVSDEVWQNAAKHYDDEELAALVFQVGLINMFNRMNVIIRQQGGDYVAGTVHR